MISFVSENLFNNLDCANSIGVSDLGECESVFIHPNPVNNESSVSGLNNYKSLTIKTLCGKIVYHKEVFSKTTILTSLLRAYILLSC